MKYYRRKAFTIMEIIVVIILVGVVVGLAVPKYTKVRENALVNQALTNLQAIHAANSMYRSRSGAYWPPNNAGYTLNDINTELSLNILPGANLTYACNGSDGSDYLCTAIRVAPSPYLFTVQLDESPISSTNPQCTVNCP